VQYVSTGAKPVLGFADALLAGLAAAAALLFPTNGRILPAEIRAMRGLAYPDLAIPLLSPFSWRDRGCKFRADGARGLCDVPSPRSARTGQVAPNPSSSNSSTARALAFKDVAMQLLAG
jgi:threonine synthase